MYNIEGTDKAQKNQDKEAQGKDQAKNMIEKEEGEVGRKENEKKKGGIDYEIQETQVKDADKKENKEDGEEMKVPEKGEDDQGSNKKQKEQIIELHVNKLQPYFSREEVEFLKEAVITNHTSQTHFTNPRAGYCYRCPLCDKLINCENLATCVKLHFNMMHYDPYKEYSIIINGKYEHPIIIQNIRKRGRNREGAKPPNSEELKQKCKELQPGVKKQKTNKEDAKKMKANRENQQDSDGQGGEGEQGDGEAKKSDTAGGSDAKLMQQNCFKLLQRLSVLNGECESG